MNKTLQPISLAGSQLGELRHVCAFFADDAEEYRVLLPFVLDGFKRGDRAVHVVNPGQRQEHLSGLAAKGIDTLIIGTGTEVWLPPQALRAALRAVGVVLDPMQTGPAIRTYNIMIGERRRVAAALIAVP